MPISVSSSLGLSQKQCDILTQLNEVIEQQHITVHINEIPEIQCKSYVSVDVEHDEAGTFVCCGISVCGSTDIYCFTDIRILAHLPFSTFSLVGHNAVTDIELLQTWGINVTWPQLKWDTMLIGHIIDSSLKDYGLKAMAKREVNITYPSYDDIVGKRGLKTPRITLDKQPMELVAQYNALDVYVTGLLFEKQRKVLNLEIL